MPQVIPPDDAFDASQADEPRWIDLTYAVGTVTAVAAAFLLSNFFV